MHQNDSIKVYRQDWQLMEPRLWSVGCFAYFNIFAFFGVLEFTRTYRVFGSLRITLFKMLGDVGRFLWLFFLIMFAFDVGLSELFWYYGSAYGSRQMLCSLRNSTTSGNDNDQLVWSASLWCFFLKLFWGVFGYLDPNVLLNHGEYQDFVKYSGLLLLGLFYITVVLILVNLLIAMMAKSYEITSANEEEEWRFYRTVIWVRYIRRDFGCPPPMNIVPNVRLFIKFCKKCFSKNVTNQVTEPVYENLEQLKRNDVARSSIVTTLPPSNDAKTTTADTLVHRYSLCKLHSSSRRPKQLAKISEFDMTDC